MIYAWHISSLWTSIVCMLFWLGSTIWTYQNDEVVAEFARDENHPEVPGIKSVRTALCAGTLGAVNMLVYPNFKV